MNREEKRKLRNLNRGVWPNKKWQVKSCERVVLYAKSAEPMSFEDKSFSRRAVAGAFSLIVFIASFGAASANQSLPGETLYSVKKIIEKGEVAIAESVGGDKAVQQKILKRRIDELEKVVQQEPPDAVKQEMAVKAVEEAVVATIQKSEQAEAKLRANDDVIIEKVKIVKDKVASEAVVRSLESVEQKISISATESGKVKGEAKTEDGDEGVAAPERPKVPEVEVGTPVRPERPQVDGQAATKSGVTNP